MKSRYGLLFRVSLIFLALSGMVLITRGAPGSVREELPAGTWRIQPATTEKIPPRTDDWGTVTAFDAVRRGWANPAFPVHADGATWANTKRSGIDSLWYETGFATPDGWPGPDGGRVFLEFDGFNGDLIVFLNDIRIGEILAPSGGEVEITRALRPAKTSGPAANVLRVFNTRNYTGISRGAEKDLPRGIARQGAGREPLSPGTRPLGLTAPVRLVHRPALAITDVFVIPSWRNRTLTLEIEVDAGVPAHDVKLAAAVFDEKGRHVLSLASEHPVSVSSGRAAHTLSATWANPVPWEIDQPWLHRVEVRLERNTKVVDVFPPVTFGFREVWTEGRELMLNGHPIRLRMTDLYGASANALPFYRLMGYNAGQIQPHPNLWWRDWHDAATFDTALLDEADRQGFALTLPAPGISFLGTELPRSETLRQAYEAEVRGHARKYRNHPSILAWTIGMNAWNPRSNIHAGTLGRREREPLHEKAQTIVTAWRLAKKADPTRLVFSHADGSLGDISSANVYLNFAPLQEREEWPIAWARDGDMPYSAVEFGPPYTANFWKEKQFLLTEYIAMYLGESAYEQETEKGLTAIVGLGLANTRRHGAWDHNATGVNVGTLFPAYWQFQDLFVNRTNRAWRAWGVNGGWVHWLLDTGYGDPPGPRRGFTGRYRHLPAPVTERPDWANPNFDIHARSNQPFLAYIAGGADTGAHTDKTHAFFAGEKFRKQVALIWDGAVPKTVDIAWAMNVGERTVASGRIFRTLSAGEISFVPLELAAPSTDERLDASLSIGVTEAGREIAADMFPFQVFPALAGTPVSVAKMALHDPEGKSAPWLRRLGIVPTPWTPGSLLDGIDVLIIGREALRPGDTLPYGPADIARGLRVVLLEQQPAVWEMLGFESIETLPRHTFAAGPGSPILEGLQPADLINWRGSPDLLPEGRQVRTYDTVRAPRWTNRHAVASVALKIPEVAGFTPILKTGFDLAWSPLLEWRHGRGCVWFSTLDLGNRVGDDPAATRLAANLVRFVAEAPRVTTRRVYYRGNTEGADLLRRLQVAVETGDFPRTSITDTLLVLGKGGSVPDKKDLARFIENGGTVMHLPREADTLRESGHAVETRRIHRAEGGTGISPVTRAIGPELLRWRDALDVTTFTAAGQPPGAAVLAGGILLERRSGAGREVALQVSPEPLRNRYADEPEKREAVQLSVSSLHRLTAQILTNLGASPSSALAGRACHIGRLSVWQPVGSWNVLGPWRTGTTDPETRLARVWPGEEDAIAGDDNPNTRYPGPDGPLDWRRVLQAGERGFIDFARDLGAGENSVVYAQRRIESDKNRVVRMRFGVDYAFRVWVNGRVILTVDAAHGVPRPGAFLVDVPLRRGENVIAIKALPGSKGFGFWAEMNFDAGSAAPVVGVDASGSAGGSGPVGYYQPLFRPFDPYQFFYW
ncbi:MAG: hypothetical protein LBK99_12385 [Opitutaceae bacterium]|jgi:beta-galactosidase|nr:hypothetical protein [Opitutaceae bacterium]